MHLSSYPTVYSLGHPAISNIFSSPVFVEEKIDGSQFSFCLTQDGELLCRSKGKQLIAGAPEHMFERAVESVHERLDLLHPGWIYRCEYLEKPHHNTLSYSRIPNGNLIGFDIAIGLETYLMPNDKREEFERIGLECVPLFTHGHINNVEEFKSLLDNESVLGGTLVEGVVVKNYQVFTTDKKIAIGKYVSEKFKEVHNVEWDKKNPGQTDILNQLILKYRTEARWDKSIQHLKESGELESSPRDIGKLMIEIKSDTKKECEDEIKNALFNYFWSKLERGLTSGFPEYYKEKLLDKAFESKGDENE